jgi:arginine exporter protein ArgO
MIDELAIRRKKLKRFWFRLGCIAISSIYVFFILLAMYLAD